MDERRDPRIDRGRDYTPADDVALEPVEETIVATEPGRLRRSSWGGVFGGVTLTVVIQLVFAVLGLAIGATTLNLSSETSGTALTAGAMIWWLISGLVAIFFGGFVAARMAGIPNRADGVIHGALVWGISTLVMIALVTTATGAFLGGATAAMFGAAKVTSQAGPNNAIRQQTQGAQASFQSILQEGQQLLAQKTNQLKQEAQTNPTQPGQNTQAQAQTRQDQAAQQQARQLASQTGGVGNRDLEQSLTRLLRESQGRDSASVARDRETVIAQLSQNGMSRDQAQMKVDQWVNRFTQQQQQQPENQVAAYVGEAAEKTGNALTVAAWWNFVVMVLGACVAMLGGALGAPTRSLIRDRF